MERMKRFFSMLNEGEENLDKIKKEVENNFDKYHVYPDSINFTNGSYFFLALIDGKKKLIAYKAGDYYKEFSGFEVGIDKSNVKICDLSNENCKIIRRLFPFTSPVSHKSADITIGLGDRLGLASAGHIRLLKGKKVFPVLAQQSIRELNLTGRTYDDVLSAASWAVFQEGYITGFGADGDHLKTAQEVKMALDYGFTMITLDCSEHIDNSIIGLSNEQIDDLYSKLTVDVKRLLESKYLGKKFDLGDGHIIEFSETEFKKTVLVYFKAINYTIQIYDQVIKNYGRNIDFEMSIDETLTSTSPESHFFVASELISGEVLVTSLAPRFCGEFQKGIDYKGDIDQFTKEFDIHAKIARHLGYKISVHSGSDKFSVFPIIGDKTNGRYHLKTAGTNWLEAVRVIAAKKPSLYRKMHEFALKNLDEAKKYYHITENIANIPDIATIDDAYFPSFMDMNDSRQVVHVTYGLILQAKNIDGSLMFRDEIYSVLNKYENEFYDALNKHIGRHLSDLGIM